MSLYGNVKKIGSASFQFDRKYNNRLEMDRAASTDGVYAGRYVLVEYGYRFGLDDNGDLITTVDGQAVTEGQEIEYVYQAVGLTENYDPSVAYYTIVTENGRQKYVDYTYNENTWPTLLNSSLLYKKVLQQKYHLINTENGMRVEGVYENSRFKTNAAIDLTNYGAVYDSTVWQKIYVSGKDKYIMVAELNAMAPKLDITQDTPLTYKSLENDLNNYRTNGIITGKINERGELIETVRLTNAKEIYNKPYFDTALDTELTYLMHLPTTLNLEIDGDTIDFNENGFNIAYSYPEDEGVSTIAWIPKGHDANGNITYLDNYQKRLDGNTDNGGNEFAELRDGSYPMDTKMLFMSFPALGNAMNALYNLLYGKPDPEDDITHGAMRPYFKRFLNNILMRNRAVVRDRDGVPIEITNTDPNDFTDYVYIEGPVGETVEAILNEADVLGTGETPPLYYDIQPSDYVEIRFRDDSSSPPIYYALDNEGYNPENSGAYVLWDKLRGQPITMTIHVPTGDEDPDLDWLKSIPALADILANNTTGLATVLSSLFGDSDPLTGTTKYYLYNDWTMSTDDNTSGPAIINKPKVVGGNAELRVSVPANAENYNLAGQQIYETPGYFWNFNLDSQGATIPYAHTEISTSKFFSGGDYSINYDTWQLVDYSTPDIAYSLSIFNPEMTVQVQGNMWQNQSITRINSNKDPVTFTSTTTLNTVIRGNVEGKWVCLDLDTGFNSIIGLRLSSNNDEIIPPFTDEDEDAFLASGAEKGHILLWVLVNDSIGYENTFTLQATGFNDAIFSIEYKGVKP